MNPAPNEKKSISEPHFAYRAWSLSSRNNWKLLEETLDRALAEAPRHGISCIEIQDYCGSWIDSAARYERFPKIHDAPRFQEGRARREETTARYKAAAAKVRDAGYELQVWYHCFRDWPREIFEIYPELRDADGQEIYDFLGDTLRDAFDFFPEITGLTVTSLHETPSVLRFSGDTPQSERMQRLYRTLTEACEEKSRRLILRDFIIKKSEFDDFDRVVDELPDTVWLQTKDVVADWASHEKPVNPFIMRYVTKDRPLVVEFEFSNNFAGEMELPWCDPEQFWRRIRLFANIGVHGCVGRLVNTDDVVAGTIFDTPNEVNVWAFSRFLRAPGKLLTAPDDSWDRHYDQFDASVWTDWAKHRYGEAAAVEIVRVLRMTPRLVNLTFNICGGYFMLLRYPSARESAESWQKRFGGGYGELASSIQAVRRCGAELARAEKAEAAEIVENALRRIERIRSMLTPKAYENIHGAFDRAKYIVAIYRALAEALVVALEVDEGKADRPKLEAACKDLRRAGEAAIETYSDNLLEGVPRGALAAAGCIENLPGRIEEALGNYA